MIAIVGPLHGWGTIIVIASVVALPLVLLMDLYGRRRR